MENYIMTKRLGEKISRAAKKGAAQGRICFNDPTMLWTMQEHKDKKNGNSYTEEEYLQKQES